MIGVSWWMDQLTLEKAGLILIGTWIPAALFFFVRRVFRKKKVTVGSAQGTADGPQSSGNRAD